MRSYINILLNYFNEFMNGNCMSMVLILNIELNNQYIDFIVKQLKSRNIEIEYIDLNDRQIDGCIQCGKCIKRNYCVNDEVIHSIGDKLTVCDAFLIASEVVYGQISEKTEKVMTKLVHSAGNRLSHRLTAPILYGRSNKDLAETRIMQYLKECSAIVLTSWFNIDWNNPLSLQYSIDELIWLVNLMNGKEKPKSEYPRNLYFTR